MADFLGTKSRFTAWTEEPTTRRVSVFDSVSTYTPGQFAAAPPASSAHIPTRFVGGGEEAPAAPPWAMIAAGVGLLVVGGFVLYKLRHKR